MPPEKDPAPPWLPLPEMLRLRRVISVEHGAGPLARAFDAYEAGAVRELLASCTREIQILRDALQRVREENAESEQLFEMLCDLHTSAAPPPKERVRELTQKLRFAILREFILAGGAS